MSMKKCGNCGNEMYMEDMYCPVCGMKYSTENKRNDGDSMNIPHLQRQSYKRRLREGVSINTDFYMVFIWMTIIIFTLYMGYVGYRTGSAGLTLLFAAIGFFAGLLSTLVVRLLVVIAENTEIIVYNMCAVTQSGNGIDNFLTDSNFSETVADDNQPIETSEEDNAFKEILEDDDKFAEFLADDENFIQEKSDFGNGARL